MKKATMMLFALFVLPACSHFSSQDKRSPASSYLYDECIESGYSDRDCSDYKKGSAYVYCRKGGFSDSECEQNAISYEECRQTDFSSRYCGTNEE